MNVESRPVASSASHGVIEGLVKDKASLQTQNAQLWRLVDKQRDMILGLQRDLQKVTSERDALHKRSKDNNSIERQNDHDVTPGNEEQRTEVPQTPDRSAGKHSGQRGMKPRTEAGCVGNEASPLGSPTSEYSAQAASTPVIDPEIPPLKSPLRSLYRSPSSELRHNDRGTIGARLPSPAQVNRGAKVYVHDEPSGSPNFMFAPGSGFSSPTILSHSRTHSHNRGLSDGVRLSDSAWSKQRRASDDVLAAQKQNQTTALERRRSQSVDGGASRNDSPVGSPPAHRPNKGMSLSTSVCSLSEDTVDPYYSTMMHPITSREQRLDSMGEISLAESEIVDSDQGSTYSVTPHLAGGESFGQEGFVNSDNQSGLASVCSPSSLNPSRPIVSRPADLLIKPADLKQMSVYLVNFGTNASGEVMVLIGLFTKDMNLIHNVEKKLDSLHALERSIGVGCSLNLPSRRDFENTDKVESRRATVDLWFSLVVPMLDEQGSLQFCEFLSTGVQYPEGHSRPKRPAVLTRASTTSLRSLGSGPKKLGYLSKRGKNFGGWKSRFFVVDGPEMRYFENQGGSQLGSIRLIDAQIGRQSIAPVSDVKSREDEQIQHAFLILEPKKKKSQSYVRHVLCADTDEERDEWIQVLLHYVVSDGTTLEQETTKGSKGLLGSAEKDRGKTGLLRKNPLPQSPSITLLQSRDNQDFNAIGYMETRAGKTPQFESVQPPLSPSLNREQEITTSPVPLYNPNPLRGIGISAPLNGSLIHDITSWGAGNIPGGAYLPTSDAASDKKSRKKSFWGFGKSESRHQDIQHSPSMSSLASSSRSGNGAQQVFGSSLVDAVAISTPRGVNLPIPSVVYRCIEYLDAKHAESEEGIYRLSGSNTVIKGLKERFNNEGDVKLIEGDEYHDVHAVAGLLKLYLRELPISILTRDLQRNFLGVIGTIHFLPNGPNSSEMPDGPVKISLLQQLVRTLPLENFELLKLISRHLCGIVENCDINKMTIRNVGIVFSPTLNIPAGILTLFISEYKAVFDEETSAEKRRRRRQSGMAGDSHGQGSHGGIGQQLTFDRELADHVIAE